MLQVSGLNRVALPRHARKQACRQARFPTCRSAQQEGSTSVSTLERSAADENDDAKMKATLSTLDALLGSQDSPTPTSQRATSSASASTSGRSGPAPARQPAPTPSQGGFKLPSLPVSDNSSSSSPKRKPAGLSFDQVMGFSGLAPEVINGRAAMIGFFIAISNELKTGESVFAQMVSGGAAAGEPSALIVILAVTVASFAPAILGNPLDEVFNKAPKKVKEWGPFTAAAEGLNGRLAMLGIALLIFFEGAGSTAFFLN